LAAKNQNDAIFQLAIIYRQEGNYQKADEFYKRLLKEKYQESEVFYNLGISCYYQKKYDEAEKYFLKAIELGNNDDPEYNLGILYKIQGKFAQSKKYLIPLAQKGKVDAMINVGAIYRDEKDYSNAKKYYKMAMDRGSREAEVEYNTILILEEHGF